MFRKYRETIESKRSTGLVHLGDGRVLPVSYAIRVTQEVHADGHRGLVPGLKDCSGSFWSEDMALTDVGDSAILNLGDGRELNIVITRSSFSIPGDGLVFAFAGNGPIREVETSVP